jgi:hypothetical protein
VVLSARFIFSVLPSSYFLFGLERKNKTVLSIKNTIGPPSIWNWGGVA